jgi:hypothetical protein
MRRIKPKTCIIHASWIEIGISGVRRMASKSTSAYEQARDRWYLDRLLDGPTDDFIALQRQQPEEKEAQNNFLISGRNGFPADTRPRKVSARSAVLLRYDMAQLLYFGWSRDQSANAEPRTRRLRTKIRGA